MSLSAPEPKNTPFGIFSTGSYGGEWVYTVGVLTVAWGLIVVVSMLIIGICMFGEDY